MSLESGLVIGSLGVSFYLLYLKNQLNERHEILKLFLMLMSFASIGFTLGHMQFFASLTADNQVVADAYWSVYIYIMIAWMAYWFLYIFYEYAYERLWKKNDEQWRKIIRR